jgi:S-adenosylmethionine:tRNA ribosyltransferase-isomerase
MVLPRSGDPVHLMVASLPELLEPGTLMVFNDTRVRKARLYATRADTGKQVEILLTARKSETEWLCLMGRAAKHKPGTRYLLPGGMEAEFAERAGDERLLRFSAPITDEWLEASGHMPLPPYIKREDALADEERYQTIYARTTGSSAAPTAGLHFTEDILAALRHKGVQLAWLTLHVGLGTFLPVREERVEDHAMHREDYTIGEETAGLVTEAKAQGRPILAVGTTSLRCLESAWLESEARLPHGPGSTSIFIYPGYRFKVVDRLFTNFHTPESSLLMLVSAFAGRDRVLEAYAQAVREGYMFFSYGDAMLLM